uniref:Uncharacterized protein n=1 Tax=Timema monikensis TaxID=170555 RepID=A0A7R9E465_9NEOP|nr:unnamed protein product [Timema monikensis]
MHKQLIYDIPLAPWTTHDQCQNLLIERVLATGVVKASFLLGREGASITCFFAVNMVNGISVNGLGEVAMDATPQSSNLIGLGKQLSNDLSLAMMGSQLTYRNTSHITTEIVLREAKLVSAKTLNILLDIIINKAKGCLGARCRTSEDMNGVTPLPGSNENGSTLLPAVNEEDRSGDLEDPKRFARLTDTSHQGNPPNIHPGSISSTGRQRVGPGSGTATSTQAAQLIGGGISPTLFTSPLANALVVLSSTAEDGEIEVQISVGNTRNYCWSISVKSHWSVFQSIGAGNEHVGASTCHCSSGCASRAYSGRGQRELIEGRGSCQRMYSLQRKERG